MRMRKKKNGEKRIAACARLLIEDPALLQEPSQILSGDYPLHLEIGCGKGNFACETARRNPEINMIAMERVSDVCCVA